MKICYHCELCGTDIAMLDVGYVDEMKFGFDCLTAEERKAIITMDTFADTMHVESLCDSCVADLGLDESEPQDAIWTASRAILH